MNACPLRILVLPFAALAFVILGGCAQSIRSADDSSIAVRPLALESGERAKPVPASPAEIVPARSSAFSAPARQGPQRWAVSGSASDDGGAEAIALARECYCENRFHITTVRGWFFRDFVPDRSDPSTFGLEVNSEFGWGQFDVANITYVELADYPTRVPGRPVGNETPGIGAATGINDVLTAFLFSKKGVHHGPHHFALGVAAQFPTASDSTLGSGKWSLGPAAEYEYSKGRFYAAFVALNVFSVAGDENRTDVNMFMLKPMITYKVSSRWKLVYMPYGISIYWNKPISKAIYLPVGGGVQYEFRLGRQKMAASLQLFQYVVRPSTGSEQDLRFMLQADF